MSGPRSTGSVTSSRPSLRTRSTSLRIVWAYRRLTSSTARRTRTLLTELSSSAIRSPIFLCVIPPSLSFTALIQPAAKHGRKYALVRILQFRLSLRREGWWNRHLARRRGPGRLRVPHRDRCRAPPLRLFSHLSSTDSRNSRQLHPDLVEDALHRSPRERKGRDARHCSREGGRRCLGGINQQPSSAHEERIEESSDWQKSAPPPDVLCVLIRTTVDVDLTDHFSASHHGPLRHGCYALGRLHYDCCMYHILSQI